MATKLPIARARARVALARHTGTILSSRVIAAAAPEFSEADDAPDGDGLQFIDAALGPSYEDDGLRKWFHCLPAELTSLEESRDILLLTTSDGHSLYPAFQFDTQGRPLPQLRELLEGLDPERDDAWADSVLLKDAAEDLHGLTPAQALGTSRAEDAIRLAQRAGGFLRGCEREARYRRRPKRPSRSRQSQVCVCLPASVVGRFASGLTATRVDRGVSTSGIPYSSHVSDKMRVFISWSGQAERLVAEALREALTEVCAGRADVFVSSQDISKGDRGLNVIEAKLKASDYGIVVMSGANQHRPWINYEGGAMARSLSHPVSTILLDLSPSDVDGPLAPYQSTQFSDPRDMQRLFTEVAKAADPDIPDNTVAVLFTNAWENILESWQPPEGDDPDANRRSEHDMLAEVVERVRGIETMQQANVAATASRPGYTRAGLRAARPELLKVAIREATDDQIGVGRMSKGAPGVLVVELVENEPTSESVRKRAYAAVHRLYESGAVDISLQPLLDPDPASMRSE